jgi:cysteinyl-tRNA synthetase
LRLLNTLSGDLDELNPTDGHVGIYVCGVTPYDSAHVGHAMSLIVYDVLVRYLRWTGNPAGGYAVTYVSNYTDVDDKLIERGAELGRDPIELAGANIDAWEREQEALGLLAPDVRPRVTLEIDSIIATIEQIIEHDYAYATPSGDVYYRVRAKDDYGKLAHRNIEDLRSGTRFEPGEDKEFPLDFALWKARKPGEPSWPSPWGEGRPGWHIECSAMAQRYLGQSFDIHGGGTDLVFPHHENEIAQAEAAAAPDSAGSTDVFARLWVHNGMIQRNHEKMSKSTGNVVTVEDALERWGPDAIRLFVLNSQYRSVNNLTDEAMDAASAGIERLRNALQPPPEESADQHRFGTAVDTNFTADFVEAMEDDLATPRALAVLFGYARAINSERGQSTAASIEAAQANLRVLAGVLGLRLDDPASDAVGLLDAGAISKLAAELDVSCGGCDVDSTIEALIERREAARSDRNFALADRIRDELSALGVALQDTAEGPRWSAHR